MKEETKKKLCKISKILGFAITFGFAVFGVLCAAMLIVNGSGAKDDIKTLDSSLVQNEVRSERNIKPRKAPDYIGGYNLLEDGSLTIKRERSVFTFGDLFTIFFGGYGSTESLYLTDYLPEGYYYMETDTEWFFMPKNSIYNDIRADMVRTDNVMFQLSASEYDSSLGPYWRNGSQYFYSSGDLCVFAREVGAKLYLVDTLEVPPSSILKLPNNWAPFSLITDQVTEDNRFGLLNLGSPTSGTLVGPEIELTNVVFRYRGVVYDKIGFSFNDASHSTGYVRSDGTIFDPLGQYVVQNVDTHVMSLNYIAFGQSWSNRWDKVVGARYSDKALPESPVDGVMWYPALGQYYWVNGGAPTIEIIDLKSETASGRYDNRYSNLNDLQLLELLSNYSASTLDIGDTGMVFDLMTIAFNSLTPILSIYILPGLTLGMVLFIPLIGGIIVIIIKVIKK